MGDAYSNAIKAREKAETYMVAKGWRSTGTYGWIDPEDNDSAQFFDAAWDIQYERDKAEAQALKLSE